MHQATRLTQVSTTRIHVVIRARFDPKNDHFFLISPTIYITLAPFKFDCYDNYLWPPSDGEPAIDNNLANRSLQRDSSGRFTPRAQTPPVSPDPSTPTLESPTDTASTISSISGASSLPFPSTPLRERHLLFSPERNISTPPSSPAPPISSIPAPVPLQQFPIMTTVPIPMFHGDGRANESPSDFLKLIQASFNNKPGITDEQKCERFFLHCKSDSDAEEWYEGLNQGVIMDWSKLVKEFRVHWPKATRVKKTAEQKKAELFADTLEEGRLLEKEDRGGVPVYAYIAWADRIEKMANSLGDTQGFLVSVIRDSLPKALRTAIGTSHSDWSTFTTAIRDLSPTTLRTAVEDENCLRSLEDASQRSSMPQSPTAPLRHAFN